MRGFGDFKRTAVIIIPDDEEYQSRAEKNKQKNTYIVSEGTENEMKGKATFFSDSLVWGEQHSVDWMIRSILY